MRLIPRTAARGAITGRNPPLKITTVQPCATSAEIVDFAVGSIVSTYRRPIASTLARVGRMISKHGEAYSYLPASVEKFPAGAAFSAMLREAGFARVEHVSMTFGVSYMYVAEKAPYTG